MIIEEKDFKLELSDSNDRFSLELLYVVNAKDAERRREEFKPAGYDMRLETCFNKIINFRLTRKQDTYSLSQYASAYKKEREELANLIKC